MICPMCKSNYEAKVRKHKLDAEESKEPAKSGRPQRKKVAVALPQPEKVFASPRAPKNQMDLATAESSAKKIS